MMTVVDGHNMLHRALHVSTLREFRTDSGVFTGGVFGVIRSLSSAFRALGTTQAIFVWDAGISTRRREILPAYRDRPRPDPDPTFDYREEFSLSKKMVNELLPSLGVSSLAVEGKEGDDTIHKVVHEYLRYRPRRWASIVTTDHDLLQEVRAKVLVYHPPSAKAPDGEKITEKVFRDRIQVNPEEYVLLKAVVGDKSDCIEGVPGVAEKTVISVLEKCHKRPVSPQTLLETAGTLKGKRYQALARSRAVVQRNLRLMDLSKERWKKSEGEQVRKAVKERGRLQLREMFDLLKKWELTVLREDTGWVKPFYRLR